MSGLEPFGPDCAWLAVRGKAQSEVIEALGLTGGEVVGVQEAVTAAVPGGRTALLPPLRGIGGLWTIVLGEDVSEPSAGRVASLSAMLTTDVQAFVGSGGARRWMHAARGTVHRHLEVTDGEVTSWTGRPTPVERSLGLPDVETLDDTARAAALAVTPQQVMDVAAQWSINPATLTGQAPGSAVLVAHLRPDPPFPGKAPGMPEIHAPRGIWGWLRGR